MMHTPENVRSIYNSSDRLCGGFSLKFCVEIKLSVLTLLSIISVFLPNEKQNVEMEL
jgi:hypothetical protein